MSLQIQDFSLLKKDSVSCQTCSQKGVKGQSSSQLWVLPASPRVDSALPLLEEDMRKGESQNCTWALLPGTAVHSISHTVCCLQQLSGNHIFWHLSSWKNFFSNIAEGRDELQAAVCVELSTQHTLCGASALPILTL